MLVAGGVFKLWKKTLVKSMSLEESERYNQPLLAAYGGPEGQNTTPNKTHIAQNVSDNTMNQKT